MAAKQAPLGCLPGRCASGAARQQEPFIVALFIVYHLLFASSSVLFVTARSICGGTIFASSRAMAD